MNTNSARTIRTIKPAVMRSPLLADERRGAPYLENVDPGAGLDDLVVVEGPGGPDLAVELHAADALVVGDPLDDHRGLPDQGRGVHPDLALGALVIARDRAQRGQQDHRDHQERRPFDRGPGAERPPGPPSPPGPPPIRPCPGRRAPTAPRRRPRRPRTGPGRSPASRSRRSRAPPPRSPRSPTVP